jgi:hypothetical protein
MCSEQTVFSALQDQHRNLHCLAVLVHLQRVVVQFASANVPSALLLSTVETVKHSMPALA